MNIYNPGFSNRNLVEKGGRWVGMTCHPPMSILITFLNYTSDFGLEVLSAVELESESEDTSSEATCRDHLL